MAELDGKPMLRFMLERLGGLKGVELVVATTLDTADDVVAACASELGLAVVRGPEADVLQRFVQVVDQTGCDHVVRLTGDCPLVDPAVVEATLGFHLSVGADYTCNVLPRTFPHGLDVEVVTADALRVADREARDSSEREHVTPFIYRRPERFKLANFPADGRFGALRWTVDNPDDLNHVREIVSRIRTGDKPGWRELISLAGEPTAVEIDGPHMRLPTGSDADAISDAGFAATPGNVLPEWWLTDPGRQLWILDSPGGALGWLRVDVSAGAGHLSTNLPRVEAAREGVAAAIGHLLDSLRSGQQITRLEWTW